MALYAYKAVDAQGKTLRGVKEASGLVELDFLLKRGGLDLVHARSSESKPVFAIAGGGKIRRPQLITFFFNLDQLLLAGVPLLDGLTDLRASMDDPAFREVIADMVEAIESGSKLSQAMAQHPRAFNPVLVSLTRAGEKSGRLAEVFEHLTESLKWQDELAAQTRNMMIYPAFVAVVVVAITLFLMIYLMPQLAGLFAGMGQEMPLHTRLLLSVSGLFVAYWPVLPLLFALLAAAVRLAPKYHPGLQYHLDRIKLRIWPTGPILRKVILARFANTFAMMNASGIGILDCIAHARDLVDNDAIARSLDGIMREIEAGKGLAQSFEEAGVFPPLVIRMLKVGEATGRLEPALRNVGYFYDRDVRESIRKAQVMIEPTLTVVLGLLLGWVMLSVLSPIYDIIGRVAT